MSRHDQIIDRVLDNIVALILAAIASGVVLLAGAPGWAVWMTGILVYGIADLPSQLERSFLRARGPSKEVLADRDKARAAAEVQMEPMRQRGIRTAVELFEVGAISKQEYSNALALHHATPEDVEREQARLEDRP